MTPVTIKKLPHLNLIIINDGTNKFFIAADGSIIISVQNLAFLLQYMVNEGFISPRLLEGILEGFYTSRPSPLERNSNDSNIVIG